MSTALAVQQPLVKASTQLSTFLGIEPSMMIETIKAQCFKGKRPDEVSDAQLASFISVCNGLALNPLIPGMVYAYPERNGGITPIIGPDGTMKKIDELISSGKLAGYTCKVYPEDVSVQPTHATAVIHRAGSEFPAEYTAYFKEWVVGQNPNWLARPRHMLWVRALKQCARQVIHGLPMDEDERRIAEMQNVTGSADEAAPAPVRPEPPKREKRGVAAVAENPKPEPKAVEAVVEVVTEKVEAKPEAKKETVKEDSPPAEKPAPKIEAGKEITIEGLTVVSFEVKELGPAAGPKTPNSIKAVVEGIGEVYHMGGNCDAWQTEQPVTLKILGKALKSGAVAAMVQSIEITPIAPADGEIE